MTYPSEASLSLLLMKFPRDSCTSASLALSVASKRGKTPLQIVVLQWCLPLKRPRPPTLGIPIESHSLCGPQTPNPRFSISKLMPTVCDSVCLSLLPLDWAKSHLPVDFDWHLLLFAFAKTIFAFIFSFLPVLYHDFISHFGWPNATAKREIDRYSFFCSLPWVLTQFRGSFVLLSLGFRLISILFVSHAIFAAGMAGKYYFGSCVSSSRSRFYG